MDDSTPTPRLAYEPPTVVALGTLGELTQGGGTVTVPDVVGTSA